MNKWWKSTSKVGSPSSSSSTLPPEEVAKLEAEMQKLQQMMTQSQPHPAQAEDPLAKAHAANRDLQSQLQSLQHAISSIVLRLKVLDLNALEKDLGADGTVPLCMALSELRQLVEAYDGMPKRSSIPDYGWTTGMAQSASTVAMPCSGNMIWTSNTGNY